ncbi:sensor histidine kinase [Mobilitalea sibirica]|uniref:histidine kinase n=1 Tax=Mobilitalea sibirica TaxID=1462919 RepID=A0A8J7L1V8_9FIRM|nr:sensor histidine kinase [Mobilitalea sibirica]MBH1939308.1 sensor histidine kinase [Mobilitalea sibirica]
MSGYSYLKDKCIPNILQILGAVAVSSFMSMLGNSNDAITLLLVGWGFVLVLYYSFDYSCRKRYYNSLLESLKHLKQKYLIADVMEKSHRLEDVIYHRILHMGNKAMLEEISETIHECNDYIEYIEQWVHEVKTPLAAMKLICDNNRTPEAIKVLQELERANRCVEQVLFYARSKNVEKDYLIKEVNLDEVVKKSIQNNKQLLLEKKIQVKLECDQSVFTDGKWIVFILDQCIVNSAKYGATNIVFYSEVIGSKTNLIIEDDGIGILSEDLPRIFDKGFTGKNGHELQKSTGIGLYLCKKLCEKLDVLIDVKSQIGSYTKIILTFATGRLK